MNDEERVGNNNEATRGGSEDIDLRYKSGDDPRQRERSIESGDIQIGFIDNEHPS